MFNSNINFNLYKTFYEVAKCKSISLAAKKNYTSQPAISKAIKKLESELDTQLFYRDLSGTVLTEKGKELFYYVDLAFNNLMIGQRIMLEDDNLKRGKLSIGVPSQIGTFYIFKNLLDFHNKYPNIEISIISKGTKDLLKLLENHEIDFIIDSEPIEANSLNVTTERISTVKNVFVCSNSFYEKYKVSIKEKRDLVNYPLILPIPDTANRKELDNWFIDNDLEAINTINIHTSEMIISAIKSGLGIGYVIYDLVKDDIMTNQLKLINIGDLPVIHIDLVYNKKFLTEVPFRFIKTYIKDDISK